MERYKVALDHGQMYGVEVCISSNGSAYDRDSRKNGRHGFWTLVTATIKRVRQGEWVDRKLNGPGNRE